MFQLKTVLGILLGAGALTGAYGLGVIALLQPPPEAPDFGQTAAQATVEYLQAAGAADQQVIKSIDCRQFGDNGDKVFVRCQIVTDNGRNTIIATLVRTMWHGLDYQVS